MNDNVVAMKSVKIEYIGAVALEHAKGSFEVSIGKEAGSTVYIFSYSENMNKTDERKAFVSDSHALTHAWVKLMAQTI